MALEGTFKDFGLADIIQLIGLQKKTGVLTVRGEDEQVVTVSFDGGMVVFADEYQRSETERLGNILLRTRRITPEGLEQAMSVQKQTLQRLGHVLVASGFISQVELSSALQIQMQETVYRLFRWKEGSYHFSTEPVKFDKETYRALSAEFLLMEGVRMIDEWPIIEKKIPSFDIIFAQVPGREPARGGGEEEQKGDDLDGLLTLGGEEAISSGTPPKEGSSALKPQEAKIYDLINGRRSVQDLIDIGQLGEFDTCKVLYGFLSLGLIQVVEGGGTVAEEATGGRRSIPGTDFLVVGAFAGLLFLSMLFNPLSYFAARFQLQKSRDEVGKLQDEIELRRLAHALDVYHLEKQAYPLSLEHLVEDNLLQREEIRDFRGRTFLYRGSERGYHLGEN